jgi:hypothetical protein
MRFFKKKIRKIFVSYFWNMEQGAISGHGNNFFEISGKISRSTLEIFRDQIIETNAFDKVVILNWKELEA